MHEENDEEPGASGRRSAVTQSRATGISAKMGRQQTAIIHSSSYRIEARTIKSRSFRSGFASAILVVVRLLSPVGIHASNSRRVSRFTVAVSQSAVSQWARRRRGKHLVRMPFGLRHPAVENGHERKRVNEAPLRTRNCTDRVMARHSDGRHGRQRLCPFNRCARSRARRAERIVTRPSRRLNAAQEFSIVAGSD